MPPRAVCVSLFALLPVYVHWCTVSLLVDHEVWSAGQLSVGVRVVRGAGVFGGVCSWLPSSSRHQPPTFTLTLVAVLRLLLLLSRDRGRETDGWSPPRLLFLPHPCLRALCFLYFYSLSFLI